MLRGLLVDAAGVLILSGPMTARRRWEREHDKPVGFLDETLRKAVGPGWQGGRSEQQIRHELTERLGADADFFPTVPRWNWTLRYRYRMVRPARQPVRCADTVARQASTAKGSV